MMRYHVDETGHVELAEGTVMAPKILGVVIAASSMLWTCSSAFGCDTLRLWDPNERARCQNEAEQARRDVQNKAEQARRDVQNKAEQAKRDIQNKAEQAKRDIQNRAEQAKRDILNDLKKIEKAAESEVRVFVTATNDCRFESNKNSDQCFCSMGDNQKEERCRIHRERQAKKPDPPAPQDPQQPRTGCAVDTRQPMEPESTATISVTLVNDTDRVQEIHRRDLVKGTCEKAVLQAKARLGWTLFKTRAGYAYGSHEQGGALYDHDMLEQGNEIHLN